MITVTWFGMILPCSLADLKPSEHDNSTDITLMLTRISTVDSFLGSSKRCPSQTSHYLILSPSLAAAILLAINLTVRCHTPPNPNPTTRKEKDGVGALTGPLFLFTRRATVYAFGIYHAFICLSYPSPPAIICRKPENLSPHLFTWNTHTIVCIVMILIAAPIRLMCFQQLGPNFTFRLDTPRKLVTTGLYSWVQHPSYTTNIIVVLANFALFERRDGVAACWLPKSVVSGEKFGTTLTVGSWVMVVIACYVLSVRIRDEEEMLKRTFSKEWGAYHKKTKRFIPYVF
jgi:protein-S-isoprenylcysteine O-methyltransferase Ste14